MRAVNLIPSEQRGGPGSGAGRSEGGAYAVLVALGGLAILALLYGIAHHRISSRQAQVSSLTAKAQQAQTTAAQLAPYTSFMALREQRMQAVSQLVDSRFDWAHAFHELGRVLPAGVSVTSLDGTIAAVAAKTATPAASAAAASPASTASSGSSGSGSSGSGSSGSGSSGSGSSGSGSGGSGSAGAPSGASSTAVTSATPAGSLPTFTLTGCSTSQATVALTLNRLRLMDGVSEVTLQSSTKSSATGGSGGGGCPTGYPVFTVQISFNPLPPASAARSSALRRSASAGGTR
jgi:uncharacterized membrane protein YgcG